MKEELALARLPPASILLCRICLGPDLLFQYFCAHVQFDCRPSVSAFLCVEFAV